MSRFVTMREARRLIGVSDSTLRRWAKRGLIKFSRTPGGHRIFDYDSLQKLVKEHLYDPELESTPKQRVEKLALSNFLERRPEDLGAEADTKNTADTADPLGLGKL